MTHSPCPPPQDQVGQPEWRAAVLGEAIRHTAHVAGPINPFPLMTHLLQWLGITEEKANGELTFMIFAMARSGLYEINTQDISTGDLWFGGETRLTAAPMLTAYIHGELF